MSITTISSRAFNQHTSHAKKACEHGPVFITDRGQPAHVLLSFSDYQKLLGQQPSIVDLLAADDDIDFEPPRLKNGFTRAVSFE